MSAKDKSRIRNLPIFSVSNTAGVTVRKGAPVFKGGHFYATASEDFEAGKAAAEFVFIQSDVRGHLREPLALKRGATVSIAVIEVDPDDTGDGFAHPMDYICSPPEAGFKYYLKKGLLCDVGPHAASCRKKKAPPVTVEITHISAPAYLCADFDVITDGRPHSDAPLMSVTPLPVGT